MDHSKARFLLLRVNWFSLGMPWLVLSIWVPHSWLEYGMGLIGWREIWLIQSMVGWNVEVPSLLCFYIHKWRAHSFGLWYENVLVIMWISLTLYSWYFCCYYVGYKHVFYQWWCMALSVFFPGNEYTLYLWWNRLYCNLWCKGAMLFSDSQVSMRLLCLNMLFTPVDAMFVTCLKKFMSWLGGFGWIPNDLIA